MQNLSLWWQNFKQKIHFSIPPKVAVALAAAIPIILVVITAGGTYIIATSTASVNDSSTQNLASEEMLVSQKLLKVPSPTIPVPTDPPPTGIVLLTPTPTPNPIVGWATYNFSVLNLNFNYPPAWNVVVGNTSGPPYLHVRNFIASGSAALQDTDGEYAVRISRFEQVGITTIDQLINQLTLNASSSVNEDGQNLGTVTVVSSNTGKINGFLSYSRVITYSSNINQQIPEVFVLDGLGNVARAVPQLDVAGATPYFNQIVSTFTFTNSVN